MKNKIPTIEEFRQIVLKSFEKVGVFFSKDITIIEDIDGFKYSQTWKNKNGNTIYKAICEDVRNPNHCIQLV